MIRRTLKGTVFTTVTLLFFWTAILADTTTVKKNIHTTTNTVVQQPTVQPTFTTIPQQTVPNTMTESEAYKLLYENQKEANDKILQTVYWSLGGVLAVLLLIIGSNIFFNIRFNKKEVELITAEMLKKLEEAKHTYFTEVSQRIEAATTDLRKVIDLDKQELSKTYQELIKSYSDNLNQQIETLKKAYEEKANLLTKQIERSERMADHQNDIIKSTINRETKLLKRDILKNDAEIWVLKGYHGLALTSFIRLAKLDFEIKYDWAFKYNADDIIRSLEKVDSITPEASAELNSVLELAKEKYKIKTDKIKNILKDKPVKKVQPLGLLGGLLGGEL
jgi:hypothetical protein